MYGDADDLIDSDPSAIQSYTLALPETRNSCSTYPILARSIGRNTRDESRKGREVADTGTGPVTLGTATCVCVAPSRGTPTNTSDINNANRVDQRSR